MTTWRRRLLAASLTLLLGCGLWSPLARPLTSAFQVVARLVPGALEYGRGGHADFLPYAASSSASVARDDSWTAPVALRIEGVAKRHVVAINPRRLLFLPWLLFAALCVTSAPPPRRLLVQLTVGGLLLSVNALVTVWITMVWLFARVPGLLYDLSVWQQTALNMLYEGYVTPMANKLIVPLFLWLLLSHWQTAFPNLGRPVAR